MKFSRWLRVLNVTLLTILLAAIFPPQASCGQSDLTFKERVLYQEKIERVYYNMRICPKENADPKPPFEEIVARSIIEDQVTSYLRKQNALLKLWITQITDKVVQARLNAIVARQNELRKAIDEMVADIEGE